MNNKNIDLIHSYDIRIKGIVQGVGFRPFIYKLANDNFIYGIVYNDTEGVFIHAEGDKNRLDVFIDNIKKMNPPLSHINSIIVKESKQRNFNQFIIDKSRITQQKSALIPPDAALCDECYGEFFSTDDIRYLYPFITCINCGPRFSIITDVPYDRENTSMDNFKMCPQCSSEYSDPHNRRFHTQPNASAECGPHLTLYDNEMNIIADKNPEKIARATLNLIEEKKIIAIKGVGGYHLAANAIDDYSVKRLRELKNRPFKPFALMAGSLDIIEKFLHVSEIERDLLLSKERPIVLLKIKDNVVSKYVAPGLSYIGIMLPYTPFHHQLFSLNSEIILIMTSGNLSEEPVAFEDDDAIQRLNGIADYFVSYNREIIAHSDDSVLFVEEEKPYFIRRSRGYTPIPFKSKKTDKHLIATGGDIKNCFALSKDDIIIVSQHIGDLAATSGYKLFNRTFNHFQKIYNFTPEAVIADMHPAYFTSKIADGLEKKGYRRLNVQHHHAHIASVMEEHNLEDNIIGIAFDGTGYGTDGTLWGSEFIICD